MNDEESIRALSKRSGNFNISKPQNTTETARIGKAVLTSQNNSRVEIGYHPTTQMN
jgi:hypothetical protein